MLLNISYLFTDWMPSRPKQQCESTE